MSDQTLCDWCGAPIEIREPYADRGRGVFHVGYCEAASAADDANDYVAEVALEEARERGEI